MKSFFSSVYSFVKVVAFFLVIGVSFYAGMYTVSNGYDGAEVKDVMATSIQNAFRDTTDQPIIMIIPNYSIAEKTKMLIGMKVPDRQVLEISTAVSTQVLFAEQIEPGYIKSALLATGEWVGKTWDGTKDLSSKAWTSTKDAGSWTYDKVKFWD